MANSTAISGSFNFNAPVNSQQVAESLNLTTSLSPTGTTFNKQIVNCTNTASAVTLSGVSTPGAIVLRNLDNTNSITYGINATAQNAILLPGALNIWSPNGTALFAGTIAGTAQLQVFATPT